MATARPLFTIDEVPMTLPSHAEGQKLPSPAIPRHTAASFLSSSISTDHHRERRRPRTGMIVTECCHNDCTHAILESYCNKRTTESPNGCTVAANANNRRTDGSTSQPQGESSERLTESNTNTATNLEQPTAVSSPDASPSIGVEQPPSSVNTSSVDKPKRKKPRKDSSEGRGTSTVSNGERERTPTRGMSKEERRRLKSEERKASRERKKELSRERRRKKKIQRKLERKKKKRLESAERSRGTDMLGLNEETTLIREPLGVDTRRTRSNLPRVSRELSVAATLAHEATSGQSEHAKRRRRNVLQQITDLFL
ncbi:uncharacterized protein [Diadema setosum]|uniref:uncharacterized protein n=1 Tax=Diadema setosum TaxID=31175 RepID=UPI003B3BB6D0